MWNATGHALEMVEGDWGIRLPLTVNGVTFTANDGLLLTVKTKRNGETILTKTYESIENNTIQLELTEAESELLPVGEYIYSLDWYQDGAFLCNVIPCAPLKVVDKA